MPVQTREFLAELEGPTRRIPMRRSIHPASHDRIASSSITSNFRLPRFPSPPSLPVFVLVIVLVIVTRIRHAVVRNQSVSEARVRSSDYDYAHEHAHDGGQRTADLLASSGREAFISFPHRLSFARALRQPGEASVSHPLYSEPKALDKHGECLRLKHTPARSHGQY